MSRHHADWLKAYVNYCTHSEAPEHFHFWTGVSTLAGALQRKVWIDQTYFQWVPNFFIFIVGPPGIVTKSTTISIGYSLLAELDVHLGAQISTWQALVKDLADSNELVEIRPATFQPMCSLSTSVSELGTFLDTQDPKLIDLLTGLWDGQLGSVKKSTITQGSYDIENPWLNVIGCTTPSWLQRNVDENLMTGGLASRAIWLYSETKRHLVAYPSTNAAAAGNQGRLRETLVEDLQQISKLVGECSLTTGAKLWGEQWYSGHYQRMKATNGSLDDALSGYVSRKQTHLHKLAMVLSAAESDDLEITEKHLERAEGILEIVEQGLPRIYQIIRQTPQTQLAIRVVQEVARHTQLDYNELYASMMQTVSFPDYLTAINAAVASGRVTLQTSGTKTMLVKK